MPFGVESFGGDSKKFDGKFSKKFDKLTDFSPRVEKRQPPNPFDFEPTNRQSDSEVIFYNNDSLWSRWRRGYDLYSLMQTYYGTSSNERAARGDYRLYFAYQSFPGLFVPARLFTFPSTNPEIGEHIVGVRDANSFTTYNFGLPIEEVRYLASAKTATYSQIGTTITVTVADHGYVVGQNVYLVFTTGSGVTDTLTVTSNTQNTFTCTAAAAVTTSGACTVRLSTGFDSPDWSETRVKVRAFPISVSFLKGERLTDRVIERDPGISFTYNQVGTSITVTCSSDHGLATGNRVFLDFSTGTAVSGIVQVTVSSPTVFVAPSLISATTSGAGTCIRRIKGFDYNNYVGYTMTGTDLTTNEILFQRADSYSTAQIDPETGSISTQGVAQTLVPAHRGFQVGRYLTAEIRHQCSCPDFQRRQSYNLYRDAQKKRIPVTPITSVKPGQRFGREVDPVTGEETLATFTKYDQRAQEGVYSDIGYVPVNNFYKLPTYEDGVAFSQPNLLYYQTRWCKHVYAAMWSIVHDEGNITIDIDATYSQSGGPNITVNAPNHGLEINTNINLEFSSGAALSGEYTVSQVLNENSFLVIYPFSQTTSGYVKVTNLKPHEYVDTWLREPNDQPIGAGLDKFYEKLGKENDRTRQQADRTAMTRYGLPWEGLRTVAGTGDLPQEVGNFQPTLVNLLTTNNLRRTLDENPESPTFGQFVFTHEGGLRQNRTSQMVLMMFQLLNVDPQVVASTKIGMLNQPLTEFTQGFQTGEIFGSSYINGVPENETNTKFDLTYVQVANTITVTTESDHGLLTGDQVLLEFASGTASTGVYPVTVSSVTTFTVTTSTSTDTSGSGTLINFTKAGSKTYTPAVLQTVRVDSGLYVNN